MQAEPVLNNKTAAELMPNGNGDDAIVKITREKTDLIFDVTGKALTEGVKKTQQESE